MVKKVLIGAAVAGLVAVAIHELPVVKREIRILRM